MQHFFGKTADKLKLFLAIISVSFLLTEIAISQADRADEWCFLTTSAIGAKQFLQAHPNYDGRGTVIFILDSGVDMGVPGLKKTSTGQTKVIDVRDFSGQGDVLLFSGKTGSVGAENYVEHPDGFRLYNYLLLDQKPVEAEFLIGYLAESRFKNSAVADINNNGRSDDLFGILVFEAEKEDSLIWLAYVDTDGDGHLEDEKALRDYIVNKDTFQLSGGNKMFDRRLLTFALNIFPYEKKVSLHFDDDGHGTHVAGIAAGYEINDQLGFYGIAPGAQLISLKIGNGTYDGGSTVSGSIKQALQFVEEFARGKKLTAIVNMSYGIGSLREGKSDLDYLINNILTFNENIFICTSNGNEGPGISTTGTPAAANLVFSVGAFLPASVANDCYGANLSSDKIFDFSSRGGELNKPDALTPGIAISAVPPFLNDAEMSGTSMAAPQAAGAAALLICAAQQLSPPLQPNGVKIKRVLKDTATPLTGYCYLDQGNGVLNVPAAFELLVSLSIKKNQMQDISYEISTEGANNSSDLMSAAYWRISGYFPGEYEKQTFFITPVFHDSVDADARANFFRAFSLKASHPWLSTEKKSVFIKGEQPLQVDVNYDPKLLTKPGLYSGKIIASQKNSNLTNGTANIEFELLNSIIIPHTFAAENNYVKKFENHSLQPGDVDRYFILIPLAATSAKISLSQLREKFSNVSCSGFSPAGKKQFEIYLKNDAASKEISQLIPAEKLIPGICEIDVYADFQNNQESGYNLQIGFNSLKIEPSTIASFKYELGDEPKTAIKITNQFNKPFYGFAKGELRGYQRTQIKTVKESDTFEYNFEPKGEVNKVEFLVDLEDDSFLKMTDVAMSIYNSLGKAVVKESLTWDDGSITLSNINDNFYSLEIKAAFLDQSWGNEWSLKLTEKYFLNESIALKIYSQQARIFKLYPSFSKELELTLEKSPRVAPDGFKIFGEVDFIDRNLLQQEFTIPVLFEAR